MALGMHIQICIDFLEDIWLQRSKTRSRVTSYICTFKFFCCMNVQKCKLLNALCFLCPLCREMNTTQILMMVLVELLKQAQESQRTPSLCE